MADCGQAPFGHSDAFLRFVAGEDVQGDPFVDRVSASIDAKVSDPAWMEGYMDYYDELEAERRAARMEGKAEGYGEGKAEGRIETMLELAARMTRDGLMGEEEAADYVGVDVADLRQALTELA